MLDIRKMGIVGEIKAIDTENMVNSNGKTVANASIIYIYTDAGVYKCLYSYNTLICILKSGYIYRLGKKWDFSHTTSKHRNLFSNRTKKELEKIIKEKMTYNSEIEQYVLNEEV